MSVLGGLLVACCSCVPALADDAAPVTAAPDGEAQARLCRQAYRKENLPYLLAHCAEEAWALARAQCERNSDSVSPRYAEFCHLFYTGAAPTYGN